MIIRKPDYYDNFHCIASDCPDSCCKAGWQIVVDDDTLDFYRSVDGKLSNGFYNYIEKKDGEYMFTNTNGACDFLDKNGLCNIQKEYGLERLCRTCRVYPRYNYNFGGLTELGLELSCPTVAEILYNIKEIISYKEEKNDELPVPNEIDAELFNFLIKCREKSIDIIQNRKYSLNKRISDFLAFNEAVHKCIRKNKYEVPKYNEKRFNSSFYIKKHINKLQKLEILTDKWKSLMFTDYPKTTEIIFDENEIFYENLLFYFVYRYYLSAVFDKYLIGRARFCVLPLYIIKYFSKDKRDFMDLSVTYSIEIEHSEENTSKLIHYLEKMPI